MRDLNDKWKPYIKLNTALLVFVLIMLWIRPVVSLREYVIPAVPDFNDRTIVYGDRKMEQSFLIGKDADAVELYMVAINETGFGRYDIAIKDQEGNITGSWTGNIRDISRDARMTYRIRDGISGDRRYFIEVSGSELDPDNAIMVANGFSVYKERLNLYAVFALAVLFITANTWLAMRDKDISKRALPVLAGCGIITFLILAPGSLPDEEFHYYSSFKMSNVLMGRGNINEVEEAYRFAYSPGINTNSAYVDQLYGIGRITGAEGKFECSEGADPYKNPVSHLAAALGITAGRIFRLNYAGVYALGRLFNMIQYVIMEYIAIRIIPHNRELMLMLSILPMVLKQCSGMSYDAVVNGLSFIFISYILKIINDDKGILKHNAVICALILIVLAPVKVVYIILAILLLAVSKKYILRLVLPLGAVGTVFLMLKWNTIVSIANSSTGEPWWTGGLESHTFSFLYEHPLRYIRALIYSIEMDGLTYIKDMAGIGLATGSVVIPDYLALGLIILVILCALTGENPFREERWQKTIFIITSVIGVVSIFTLYLFNCTVYGQPRIMGAQGRYFIPFMVLPLFCIGGKRINIDIDRSKLFVPVWFIQTGYIIYALSQVNPGA